MNHACPFCNGTGQRPKTKASIPDIIKATALAFDVAPDELTGSSRNGKLIPARTAAVYLARELSGHSWKHIGSHFGGRDHSTIMTRYKCAEVALAQYGEFRQKVRMLTKLLKYAPEVGQ